jgi:hypothetical protein
MPVPQAPIQTVLVQKQSRSIAEHPTKGAREPHQGMHALTTDFRAGHSLPGMIPNPLGRINALSAHVTRASIRSQNVGRLDARRLFP